MIRWSAGALVAISLAGATAMVSSEPSEPPPSAVAIAPLPTVENAAVETRDFPKGIEPNRIVIPAIGVDANVVALDLAGPEPEVPSDFSETGWYTQTRRPGEIGPAVVAGHVDSTSGPAVFLRLDELEPNDEISVLGADGSARTFRVTGAGRYPKLDLPDEVFGFGEPTPELRLITCGGSFDRSIGHYRDNYIVYARQEA